MRMWDLAFAEHPVPKAGEGRSCHLLDAAGAPITPLIAEWRRRGKREKERAKILRILVIEPRAVVG